MKKTFLYYSIFFCSAVLYSAEPLVKFYLNDGSTKQYNLSQIDSLGVIDKKNNYVMRIHYMDSIIAYYPTEIIGSIKFEKGFLNVYIFSYPELYLLSSIDSLVFYIDQWQPLSIGRYVWMLKNLNVDHYRNGDSIPEVTDIDSWQKLRDSSKGARCYYNNSDSLGKIYGKLYNWFAVNDERGLAPLGWHVASDYEWDTSIGYLWGESVAGSKLKESGTRHWNSPNKGATNSSGFSALPGGYRDYFGTYFHLGLLGCWWSSANDNSETTRSFALEVNIPSAGRCSSGKVGGFSVRCVKDGK